MKKILYYDQLTKEMKEEKIYGDSLIRFLYEKSWGKNFQDLLTQKYFSQMVGLYYASKASASKVKNFVSEFNINASEFEKGTLKENSFEDSFINFNEFFIRKYKPHARPFPADNHTMGAACEGRYFGFNQIKNDHQFPVKGKFLSAQDLLVGSKYKNDFNQGPLVIARLCPVDYHRYHYPDDGKTLESYRHKGKFHSVNPLALMAYPKVFLDNEKQINILETKNFGLLAYVEVGAICVGKMVQTHLENSFQRGKEKGYFLFGASTVIILGQRGKWVIDSDIEKRSHDGIETYLSLGAPFAKAI